MKSNSHLQVHLHLHYKDQMDKATLTEIINVYSENHTEHINKSCGQNTEFINVQASYAPTYSNQYYYYKKGLMENAEFSEIW